jgi:hypothetical protein
MSEGAGVKKDDERGTRQVRVYEDIGDMISWIIRVEGGTTASLLDPLVRAEVTERFLRHKEKIERLKQAEDALRKVEEEVKRQASQTPKKGRK